jgi:glycosyltransferase involved in cell wall biosynthesis
MENSNSKISAVVICFNEERNIERCINSLLTLTNDIIIVDSGSTDNTLFLAKSLGARVFERVWTGYSDQKNFGNEQAKGDFILSIDADECISEQLSESILEEMKMPTASVYEFEFLTAWSGRFIKHGGWIPDRHCRLFDKTKIKWGSKGVHEELLLDGLKAKRLKGFVFHHTAESRLDYRDKMTRYAQEFAANKKRVGTIVPFWKKYVSAFFRFVRDYLLKRGFLEGNAGWEIAVEETRYTFLKYKWSEKS